MLAFLNIEKSQKLLNKYVEERGIEVQQNRERGESSHNGGTRHHDRSLLITGVHQGNLLPVKGGHDIRKSHSEKPRLRAGYPPNEPALNYPSGAGIFDAHGRVLSPLSNEILNTPMPEKYKVPHITPYNGVGNPTNFLGQFKYNILN